MAGWIWRPRGGGGQRLDDGGLGDGAFDPSSALAMAGSEPNGRILPGQEQVQFGDARLRQRGQGHVMEMEGDKDTHRVDLSFGRISLSTPLMHDVYAI